MTSSLRLPALFAISLCTLSMRSHTVSATPIPHALQKLPRITAWSWQRREDLSSIDTTTAAIALLRETIYLTGPSLHGEPQHNTVIFPRDTQRIDVVRLEAQNPALTDETADNVAHEILRNLRPGAVMLQVDFDAVQSQRAWYRVVLTKVRKGLPREIPLSITALASWCSRDTWMRGLPIDEAVPMMFRMEPDRRHSFDYSLPSGDPLCGFSAGISTRERWPRNLKGRRVYIFPDGGWARDNPDETLKTLQLAE